LDLTGCWPKRLRSRDEPEAAGPLPAGPGRKRLVRFGEGRFRQLTYRIAPKDEPLSRSGAFGA